MAVATGAGQIEDRSGALLGRGLEEEVLEGLLRGAREEISGVLVLAGEAGVGKTALLDRAIEQASDFRVARVVGVESEMEMPYAALSECCRPMLDRIDRLPAAQASALEVACGLTAGPPPEPLLVGLAGLSLLSDLALGQPVLSVIDDAQWLDRASASALGFIARRLLAESVVMLFATREPSQALVGLPEMAVAGLPDEDARQLLTWSLDGPVDERVRERIIAEAGGNPLALLELPRGLSAGELAVGVTPSSATPVASRIEESFASRIALLPQDTRRLLLLAALEPLGGPQRVEAAARRLSISSQARQSAVDAGLLDVGPDVCFGHPLIRSAIQHSASLEDRRWAHTALAEASDPERDPDRRAWHRAQSASGPDESIAVELERSAGRARERGGLAAAAAFLELSSELTVDRARAAQRLLRAAGAQQLAGASERAQELLAASLPDLEGVPMRATAIRLEGALRFADGRGGDTPSLLLEAGIALREIEPMLARETLMEAMEAAMWAGELTTGTTTLDVARAASTIRAPAGDANPVSLLLSGYTKRFIDGYPAAVGLWRQAIAAFDAEVERSPQTQWHGMVWNATGEMLDFGAHIAVASRWLRLAREQGALATLSVALSGLGWCEMLAGRVQTAESLLSEALDISAATGSPAVPGANETLRMCILDWRGGDSAPVVGESVTREAVARGQGAGVTLARYGRTIYELGHGRYEHARSYALSVFHEDPLYLGTINLADVIEATLRSGDLDGAEAALDRLELRASATATPWGLGLLARGRALLADDEEAERHYAESLDHLGRSGVTTEQARTRLLYGEWLRRRRRRRDARAHLRLAHELFEAIGAEAFARRATAELLATGETARRRVPHTRDLLTPRERQIAQLAAEGHTNAAIGAQLFISPHTVAYHLRKVFSKLGVTARSQLGHWAGEWIGPADAPEFESSEVLAV